MLEPLGRGHPEVEAVGDGVLLLELAAADRELAPRLLHEVEEVVAGPSPPIVPTIRPM